MEQAHLSGAPLDPRLADEPQLPKCGEWLWDQFILLNTERQSSGYGGLSLTSTQIKHYCELNQITLSPLEVQMIRAMETAYLNTINKEL